MRAGKLDRRITIQRKTVTRGEYNAPVESWNDLITVWAQQRPNRGSERFTASEIHGQQVMTFHIRYRDDLFVTDRIFYQAKPWQILDIREVGRRVVTEIDAVAETPGN